MFTATGRIKIKQTHPKDQSMPNWGDYGLGVTQHNELFEPPKKVERGPTQKQYQRKRMEAMLNHSVRVAQETGFAGDKVQKPNNEMWADE